MAEDENTPEQPESKAGRAKDAAGNAAANAAVGIAKAIATRNAGEAFADRQGNCLSLVVMTAAFAKALGLPLQFNQARLDDSWSLQGDLLLASGHVNLTLTGLVARALQDGLITLDEL